MSIKEKIIQNPDSESLKELIQIEEYFNTIQKITIDKINFLSTVKNSSLDYSSVLSDSKFAQLSDDIMNRVENFLGYTSKVPCSVEYHNDGFFKKLFGRAHTHSEYYHNVISILPEKKELIVSDIGHEYTHHLLSQIQGGEFKEAINEGICRSVGRYIQKTFFEETGNPSYLLSVAFRDAHDTMRLCHRLSEVTLKFPAREITSQNYYKELVDIASDGYDSPFDIHAVGNTIVLLAEAEEKKSLTRELFYKIKFKEN